MPLSLPQTIELLFTGQSLTNYLLDLNARGYIAAMYLADVASQATYTGTFAGTILRNAGYTSGPGAELVTNGSFATDTVWTKGTAWTISGGKANCSWTGTETRWFYQSIVIEKGTTYHVTFTVSNTVGSPQFGFFDSTGAKIYKSYFAVTDGAYDFYFISGDAAATFAIWCTTGASFSFSIDNFSLIKVGQLDAAIGGTTPWLAAGGLSSDGLTSNLKILFNTALAQLNNPIHVFIDTPTGDGENSSGSRFYWDNSWPFMKFVSPNGIRQIESKSRWSVTHADAVTNLDQSTAANSKRLTSSAQLASKKIQIQEGFNGALRTLTLTTDTAGDATIVYPTTESLIGLNSLGTTTTFAGNLYKWIIFNGNALATKDAILQQLTTLAGV